MKKTSAEGQKCDRFVDVCTSCMASKSTLLSTLGGCVHVFENNINI